MLTSQRNKYLETSIQTATPAQLLVMLCDGAIRFCRGGIEAIKSNKYDEANNNLCRAQEIISEFIVTLDRQSPIADNLSRLYEYFNFRLIEANTKKLAAPAEEVLGYLLELKETWIQAAKLANQGSGTSHG
ncbi:flagellar export chaperone FliS [Paenibacillus sp. H1-7]|uniref:flagellar export chaperone FliS n=1 Tax=Paenibacillus sp. H1-7 TaxID=2282849 RepID=UPI001EF8D539|nr:flagellar export chaperone FliS [Paenibacillus sp. H1-7]ULL20133.1 flagellar export chaperone FliS [Paenibacillus sp. H1-7]